MTTTTSRTDFDRCFESTLPSNRQAVVLHKFHVGDDLYHVCTIDSNNYYSEGWYRLDRDNWTLTRVEKP